MNVRRIRVLALLALAAGCAHYPENARLAEVKAQNGYRFRILAHPHNSDSLLMFLAFSGGGMRASALSYGVLEELAHTPIVWEGEHKRLVDEVDQISAVSGGSFTAAYYALYGYRLSRAVAASAAFPTLLSARASLSFGENYILGFDWPCPVIAYSDAVAYEYETFVAFRRRFRSDVFN
jgi:hypothetical protein